MQILVNDQHTFLFIMASSQQEDIYKKIGFNLFYCCNRIILALVLQLICETIFFSYLYYPLPLLVADLALFERIIVSDEGCQLGSKVPHVCYRVSSCWTLDTVKFWVNVAIEPSALTDGDIPYCTELSCSQVVFLS